MNFLIQPKRKSTNSVNDIDNDSKISDEQIAHFDHIFHSLDPEKMWTLKSGRVVEKVIYEYARDLKYESYVHSFIISDIDEKVKSLFRNEEWEEILSSNRKTMPKIDKLIIDIMKKYSVTDLSSFREIIFEPFLPTNTSCFNFDLNYVNFVYRAIHTLWEDDDFTLDPSRLEGWYQHNIWSSIIDHAFRNSRINLIRGEGMSLASSDRKNDTSCDVDQKTIGEKSDGILSNDSFDVDRKKIGRKGDGIFRLKGDRLEFGAIEAGR